MKVATLCFPIERNANGDIEYVLLGMKKIRFGKGKWNGFGGKVEEGETIPEATARELQEESGLVAKVEDLIFVATLSFRFPHKPEWNQVVHAYLVEKFTGDPVESDEMKPMRFHADAIPYKEMWLDDLHWLPAALQCTGELDATFTFDPDKGEVLDTWVIRYRRKSE